MCRDSYDGVLVDEDPDSYISDTDLTESYLKQFGAAWDDPDQAEQEMNDE